MKMQKKTRKKAAKILLAMGLGLAGTSLHARETRKTLNSPTPTYLGGHPILVNAVQDTLRNWKYAPASSETMANLVFNFHP